MGFGASLGSAITAYEKEEATRIKAEKKRVLQEDGTTTPPVYSEGTVPDPVLLDSISMNEGTFKTGYDTEYGYGKFGEDRKPLNEMTINEVMDYQDNMSGNSTAIGRYQMLRQTLQDEMKHGGFDGNQYFTDEMQDNMILNRLKRMRGYDDWRGGKLSDKDFQKNLSREFASVQDPYTGQGYYKGQSAKPLTWNN